MTGRGGLRRRGAEKDDRRSLKRSEALHFPLVSDLKRQNNI